MHCTGSVRSARAARSPGTGLLPQILRRFYAGRGVRALTGEPGGVRNNTKEFLAYLMLLAILAVGLGTYLVAWTADASINGGRGCIGGWYTNEHGDLVRGDTHPACRNLD